MRILAAIILIFLGLIFVVPICVGVAIWLTGDPMNYSFFLIPGIVAAAWMVGRLLR